MPSQPSGFSASDKAAAPSSTDSLSPNGDCPKETVTLVKDIWNVALLEKDEPSAPIHWSLTVLRCMSTFGFPRHSFMSATTPPHRVIIRLHFFRGLPLLFSIENVRKAAPTAVSPVLVSGHEDTSAASLPWAFLA